MPDPFPSCFGEYAVQVADISGTANRTAQNLVTCVYQTKFSSRCRLITITWCKNLVGQEFTVNVDDTSAQSMCKVDLKPWYYWKKQGFKNLDVGGKKIEVFWDMTAAKYTNGPEPQEGFYLAIVSHGEIVLLLGDMVKEAFKRTQAKPPSIEPLLLSRKEHVFGKRYYTTKAQFAETGRTHDIMIECHTGGSREPRLCIRVDKQLVVLVKRLMWKFRGNQTILVDGLLVELFWDVHDWLFNANMGNAVFMFQTYFPVDSESWVNFEHESMVSHSLKNRESKGIAGFSLLLYAWRSQ
ncbi:hypothetical protein O6H91_11G071000 [Diphasiastrum complanatum]|uniref:Uncharacterized protein n=1 Tax=Diphasiastrum complanatum TaxID=34168 RepID=A0ACC2CAB4_DIPCM|nr:hypothetical protein O6H91_11G071000 [Diphasiastrum complanatum]